MESGQVADESLARQVIPARNGEHGPDPQRLGRRKVIHLRRAQLNERGDDHHVRRMLPDVFLQVRVDGNASLEQPKKSPQRGAAGGAGSLRERDEASRRAVARTACQMRRRGIARVQYRR